MQISAIHNTPDKSNIHRSYLSQQTSFESGNGTAFFADNKNTSKFQKENALALAGSVTGVCIVLGSMMKKQKIKNPFKLNYRVQEMLAMAGCADIGGILLSSAGKNSNEKKKKWTEGAFQFALTSTPLLFVDTILKLCSKSKKHIINNNITKIAASAAGVYTGSHLALAIANKLRKHSAEKQPQRKLRPIDMIANFDDAVAIMVLAKIPFADKIQIKRLLPFIYSFCGYRSGTGNTRS